MKKIVLLLLFGSLIAQTLPSRATTDKMSDSEKMMLYNMNKKDPSTAIIYSLLLSSAGHAYAGKWGRGLLFTGAQVASVVVAVATCDFDEYDLWDDTCYPTGTSYMFYGLAGVIGIWQIFDASKVTKEYNRNVYRSIYLEEPTFWGFNLKPTYKGANLTLSYTF